MIELPHRLPGHDRAEPAAYCQTQLTASAALAPGSRRSPVSVIIEDDRSVMRVLSEVLQLKYNSLTLIHDLATLTATRLHEVDCVYLGLQAAGRDWQAAISLLARLDFKGEIKLVSHLCPSEVRFCEAVLKRAGLTPSADHIYLRTSRAQRYISSIRRSLKFVRQLTTLQPLSVHHPVYQFGTDRPAGARVDF